MLLNFKASLCQNSTSNTTCVTKNSISSGHKVNLGESKTFTFNKFQTKHNSSGACLTDFTYDLYTNQTFIVVYATSLKVLIQPHSSPDIGKYDNVVVKATSTKYSDVILYSNNFTVEIINSSYPYYSVAISPIRLYPSQTVTYTFPTLLGLKDQKSTIAAQSTLPSYGKFDGATMKLNLSPSITQGSERTDIVFDLNVVQQAYQGSFYGSIVLDYSSFNQYLILPVYIKELEPYINITISNVTSANRVTLKINGASDLMLSDPSLDFKYKNFFSTSITNGNNTNIYDYKLVYVSMSTTELVFDVGYIDSYPNEGDVLMMNFTNDKFLTNKANFYKVNTVDPLNISLSQIKVNKTTTSTEADQQLITTLQSIKAAGQTASSTTGSLVGFTTLLNLLQGASMSFLWSLINALQMYEFMPLAQVQTPEFVYEMVMKFSIAKFDFIPKESILSRYFNTSQCGQSYKKNFAPSNYPSTNFFFNQLDIFILVTLLASYFAFLALLHLLFRRKTKYFLVKMENFRYNAIFRLVTEEYLPIVVPALITIRTFNTTNSFEVASIFFAFGWLILFMSIASISIVLMVTRFKQINHNKPFYLQRIGSLFEDFKTNRRIYLMYHPFFFLNRSFIAYSLIFCTDNFYLQIWIIIVSQFFFLLYLLMFRPFKGKTRNGLEIFNETCIFISSGILFGFSQLDSKDSILQFRLGWIYLSVLTLNVGVNVIKGFGESSYEVYQVIRKKCAKRFMKKGSIYSLKQQIQDSYKARFEKSILIQILLNLINLVKRFQEQNKINHMEESDYDNQKFETISNNSKNNIHDFSSVRLDNENKSNKPKKSSSQVNLPIFVQGYVLNTFEGSQQMNLNELGVETQYKDGHEQSNPSFQNHEFPLSGNQENNKAAFSNREMMGKALYKNAQRQIGTPSTSRNIPPDKTENQNPEMKDNFMQPPYLQPIQALGYKHSFLRNIITPRVNPTKVQDLTIH